MFIAVKMARLQHFTKRVKSAQKVATAVGPQRGVANRMLGATGVSDSTDDDIRYAEPCSFAAHRYALHKTESETLTMFFAGTAGLPRCD